MAIADGTNAGFVTVRPTSDPAGSTYQIDTRAEACKFTSPSGNNTLLEIGWYCDNATEEANFEVAIYSDDSANTLPLNILASNKTNVKGTDAGWKYATVNYVLSASTVYWLAVQLDDTATNSNLNVTSNASYRHPVKSGVATLPDPWANTTTNNNIVAIYGLYTVNSASASPSASESASPSSSVSSSISASPSSSPSSSPSEVHTPSASESTSPSTSESSSISSSPSVSESSSPSTSPSTSESASPSTSESASPSASESPSPSASPSASVSASPSASPSLDPATRVFFVYDSVNKWISFTIKGTEVARLKENGDLDLHGVANDNAF